MEELDRGAEQARQIRAEETQTEIEEEVSKVGLEEGDMIHPEEGRPGILALQQGSLDLKGRARAPGDGLGGGHSG
eukprot:5461757-Pyramimonas_sp.AAC.1